MALDSLSGAIQEMLFKFSLCQKCNTQVQVPHICSLLKYSTWVNIAST